MADVHCILRGFRNEDQLNSYIIGTGTDADNHNIIYSFQQYQNLIVVGYLADRTELPQVRYSPAMEVEYAGKSVSDILELAERNAYWLMKSISSLQLTTFRCTEQQLDEALIDAVPLERSKAERVLLRKTTSEQKQLYDDNYQHLLALADKQDRETIMAIRRLCQALLQADVDVAGIYNRQTATTKATGLTPADYLRMLQQVKKIAGNLSAFLSKDFKNGDELLAYVNANYVDASALGVPTHFLLSAPFEKLSYQQRKKLLLLLLDGRKLDFSGFWAGAHWDGHRDVSAGDVVFNLLNTAKKDELHTTLQELNDQDNLYYMVAAASDNFLSTATLFLADAALSQAKKQLSIDDLLIEGISSGNFFFYDAASKKEQLAYYNGNIKRIGIENKGYNYEPPPDNQPSDSFSVINTEAEKDSSLQIYNQQQAAYLQQYSSGKHYFRPLDLIVLTAESDINSNYLTEKISKDAVTLIPACQLFAILKEKTDQKVQFYAAVSLFLLTLPLNVSALVTALQEANTLGVIVNATDIGVDVTMLIANAPGFQESAPELTRAINQFVFFYAMARIGYVGISAGVKAAGKLPNVNLVKAIQQLTEQAKLKAQNLAAGLKADLYIAALNKVVHLTAEPIATLKKLLGQLLVTKMQKIGLVVSSELEEGIRVLIYKGVTIVEGNLNTLRKALQELFRRQGKNLISFLEDLIKKRKQVFVKNIEMLGEIGKDGKAVTIELVDGLGNNVGSLVRSNEKANKITYYLIFEGRKLNIRSSIQLLDDSFPSRFGFPIEQGENLLYADLAILPDVAERLSGLGKIMLDDALAYFKNNKNFGKVDGILGVWTKNDKVYRYFGGQSVNLRQFWEARNARKSIEEAAFSTFTGGWAKEAGFINVRYNPLQIEENSVILKFKSN